MQLVTLYKTSRHKQCKTGEIQSFTCKTAKQAFVELHNSFYFRDIIFTGAVVVLQRGIGKK